MDNTASASDSENLCHNGKDLVKQLQRVLEKVKQKLDSREDTQPQRVDNAGDQHEGGNASKKSQDQNKVLCAQIRMEPREIRLQIKLETWMSENGTLIIRPSLMPMEQSISVAPETGDYCVRKGKNCQVHEQATPLDHRNAKPDVGSTGSFSPLGDSQLPGQQFSKSVEKSSAQFETLQQQAGGRGSGGGGGRGRDSCARASNDQPQRRSRQTNNHHGQGTVSDEDDPDIDLGIAEKDTENSMVSGSCTFRSSGGSSSSTNTSSSSSSSIGQPKVHSNCQRRTDQLPDRAKAEKRNRNSGN